MAKATPQDKKIKSTQMHMTLDAKRKTLGRLASEIAFALQGKHTPHYTPHSLTSIEITVHNINDLQVTGAKMKNKQYWHYSGYPGGIYVQGLAKMWEKNPQEVLWRAVYGMLPKNTLRNKRIKNLKIDISSQKGTAKDN